MGNRQGNNCLECRVKRKVPKVSAASRSIEEGASKMGWGWGCLARPHLGGVIDGETWTRRNRQRALSHPSRNLDMGKHGIFGGVEVF